MRNEIVIFENQEVKLEVNVKDDTVWLNREQLSKLFNRDIKTIGKHIHNALKEELKDTSVVAKFATTAHDGKVYQVEHYNLDMIISVGYRVKSQNGIVFRRWATGVLKDYMLKGYAVNQRRLEYLEKTVQLLDIAGRIDYSLESDDAEEIIKVINHYSSALNLLDDYDYKTMLRPKGISSYDKIQYDDCMNIIHKLKFNNNSDLFALERNYGLFSIIQDIYQSFDDKDVYPTVEEKAANLLYLITKNHVFIDGNKRIAATLFIYFLEFYHILYKDDKKVIDNHTLVAITLLIAQSNPKEKEIIIDLVMNFLIN